MEKERQGKNIVIALLLVTVVCMSAAFAAFTNIRLNVNGTVDLPTDSKWEVKFSSVAVAESSDIKTQPSLTDNTVNYTVDLEEDTTYSFVATIANNGTYDAKLKALTLPEIPAELTSLVTHTVTGVTANSTIIPAGESVDVTVTVAMGKIGSDELLKAVQESKTLTMTIIAEFEQAQ